MQKCFSKIDKSVLGQLVGGAKASESTAAGTYNGVYCCSDTTHYRDTTIVPTVGRPYVANDDVAGTTYIVDGSDACPD